LHSAANRCRAELKRDHSDLSTISYAAPFAGLFVAALGVINAIRGVTEAAPARLEALAGGIPTSK